MKIPLGRCVLHVEVDDSISSGNFISQNLFPLREGNYFSHANQVSKSLSKEQIEAVFAKFDSNKVFKLLHIDIAHNRDIETQFHEGWETEQGGVQELDGKQKIINSGIFARYPEQLVRIFEDR